MKGENDIIIRFIEFTGLNNEVLKIPKLADKQSFFASTIKIPRWLDANIRELQDKHEQLQEYLTKLDAYAKSRQPGTPFENVEIPECLQEAAPKEERPKRQDTGATSSTKSRKKRAKKKSTSSTSPKKAS